MSTAATVFGIIQTIIQLAPQAITSYEQAKSFIIPLWNRVTGGADPTDQEIADLEAQIDALHIELQAPLPDGP